VIASAPESSEIFSSSSRDEGASGFSWQKDGVVESGCSDFMGDLQCPYDLTSIGTLRRLSGDRKIPMPRIEKSADWEIRSHGIISRRW
jgi:hypothetical protein